MNVSTKRPRKQQKVEATVALPLSTQFRPPRRQPSFATQIGAVASKTAPEEKSLDQAFALTPTAAFQFSALQLLNPIPQGVSTAQRIGRRVVITKIVIRWRLVDAYSRFMVVYDHAPNGSLPLITDILNINDVNGVNNLANNDRFMILHDEYICSTNTNAVGGTMAGKWIYKRQPLINQWATVATGTIADITTGAIYAIHAGPSTGAVLTCYARVRYTDQ